MTAALANDPVWLKGAYRDLGVHEIAGKQHNKRVLEMFQKAGHPEISDDETAWCSAAVNTWMVEAGYRGTSALNARSWLTWGKPVTGTLPRGTVVVFKRGNSGWEGHVALCLSDNGATLSVLGGNQSDQVCIRSMSRSKLIGARWPDGAGNSVTVKAFAGTALSSGGAQAAGETASYLDKASSLPVEDGLQQAQELAQQAAQYLRWAQYALVVIGLLIAAYGAYRFVQRWLHPEQI